MGSDRKTRIVCIGDSITEGFGLNDTEAFYPSLLQQFLGSDYEVFNQGVTGSCVTNLEDENGRVYGMPYVKQSKYMEALELAGDIYVVMLGTNDANDGMDNVMDVHDNYNNLIAFEDQFEIHYQNLLDSITVMVPDAMIFVVTPIPILNCIWRKHQEAYMLQIVSHIKAIAERDPEFHLIDLHNEFVQISPDPKQLEDLYLKDGLHPNAAGAFLIASVIAYHLGNRSYQN